MNTEQKEFKELSQTFASIETGFKTLMEANGKTSKTDTDDIHNRLNACMEAMYGMISNVHNRIDNLHGAMYAYQDKHSEGHLPPIKGAGAMNKALACLGMDEDYAAQKKTLYASKDLFSIKTSK